MAPKLLKRIIHSLFTMKISPILAATTISATTTAHGLVPGLPTSASHNATTAPNQLSALISHASTLVKSYKRSLNSTCTLQNAQIRREWGILSVKERIAYMNAIRCLQTKSAKSPPSWAPGAKTRFDDWVATHIDQTLTTHYTGIFLAWHRYFLWEYEQALRNECGYQGTQPYWNWGITAKTGLESSPVWDGSATSMSGNDAQINQTRFDVVLGGNGLPEIILPAGSGGGCVESGPFANMSVNLGPAALGLRGNKTKVNPDSPMAYNPRCLKRDLTDYVNQRFANFTAIVDNIVQPQNV